MDESELLFISVLFHAPTNLGKLMNHGNVPSKGASIAHALITGDCDAERCCHLKTPGLRGDDTRQE